MTLVGAILILPPTSKNIGPVKADVALLLLLMLGLKVSAVASAGNILRASAGVTRSTVTVVGVSRARTNDNRSRTYC